MEEVKKKLQDELDVLEEELHFKLPKEIQKAREFGDLRENAEYKAAMERQSIVQARIRQIHERLSEVKSIDLSKIPTDRAAYGSSVVLFDLDKEEKIAYPQAIPALGAALSNPTFDAESRAAMARALGSIRRPAAATPLQAALGDREALVRAAALAALRKVEGFRDGSVATPLISDADAGVRSEAIYTVAEMRTVGSAPALVQALQNDASPDVRKRAAWALGRIGASAAVAGPALSAAATSDASPLVRSLARAAIAGLTR